MENFFQNLIPIRLSLRARIKVYQKRAAELERYLSERPEEWGKFQSEFNSEVNAIFREIMNFEKVNLSAGDGKKVYKLKKIFMETFRKIFRKGIYGPWSLDKPFGYAGDFKIVDDIYQNNPTTIGFDRLCDNYFQMSAISVAVRNRKEDFKRFIVNFINERQNQTLRIMSLASGSCREIREIFSSDTLANKDIVFDCYEREEKAVEFAKALLSDVYRINFIRVDALKLARSKDINNLIKEKYSLIYSAGLFDYLSDKVAIYLVHNLKKVLTNNSMLWVSNVRDKYSNPSIHYMEWAGDWNLFYRSDEEFKRIFMEAGFMENELKIQYEQQGIMQYMFASNKSSG